MCVGLMHDCMKLFSTEAKQFVWSMFKAKSAKSMAIPLLTLGVLKVKSVSCYKYLVIVLDIELSDDKDI